MLRKVTVFEVMEKSVPKECYFIDQVVILNWQFYFLSLVTLTCYSQIIALLEW